MYSSYSYSKMNTNEIVNKSTPQKLEFLQQYLLKQTRSSDARDVLQYILKSQNQPHQYQLMKAILEKISQRSPSDLRYALGQLDYYLDNCRTFESFLLLVRYMLTYEATISTSQLQNNFNMFSQKYVFHQKQIIEMQGKNISDYKRIIEAVRIGMEVLPKLYRKLNKNMDFRYLSVLVDWILICPAASVQDCRTINSYSRFLAQQCMENKSISDAFDCSETRRLLVFVIQRSVLKYQGGQNMCFILESLNDMVISSAISSRIQSFTQLPPQMYLNCFNALVRASMGARTIRFMICISNALKEDYQFHILKLLYENFIVPKLVRYYKTTTTAQSQLQDLVSLYVYGFMGRITLQNDLIKYFLTDFKLLPKKSMIFWLQIAVTLAYQNPSAQRAIMPIINQITPMKTLQQIVNELVYANQKKHAWRFLDKDLKEKKRYQFKPSKKSGIINQNVNCYIITVMQAFFMSKSLPNLIKDYQSNYSTRGYLSDQIRLPLLYQINRVFDCLKRQDKKVTIDDVKKVGPIDFRDPMQQDCQHYFNELFESISKQIQMIPEQKKRKQFINKFKQLFEIVIRNERVCEKCGNKSENQMECYIHSIDYTEILCQQWQSILEDYTCDKCKHKGNQKQKSRIVKFPQIIILHIKRFQFDRDLGQVKKLQEANIIRKFRNYELQGFISHIGNQVRCGHYILYYKSPQDPLNWILFSDTSVRQFKINTTDEKFQVNFKSDNTPYIAIYKRNNRG